MLAEPAYAERAKQVAEQLSHEDGLRTACDALEALYRNTHKPI
jgi:UDP:flavonoid glycosyltransferase YjiC (YdhE family)